MFVHRSDLNKFGHLPIAFIELFSTVLIERHGGGAPSEGLQPEDLSFEQIHLKQAVRSWIILGPSVGQLGICPPLNMTVLKLGSAHHHGQTPNDL